MRVTNLQTKPTDQCKLQQRESSSRHEEIVKSVACGARTEFQVENTLCAVWSVWVSLECGDSEPTGEASPSLTP